MLYLEPIETEKSCNVVDSIKSIHLAELRRTPLSSIRDAFEYCQCSHPACRFMYPINTKLIKFEKNNNIKVILSRSLMPIRCHANSYYRMKDSRMKRAKSIGVPICIMNVYNLYVVPCISFCLLHTYHIESSYPVIMGSGCQHNFTST